MAWLLRLRDWIDERVAAAEPACSPAPLSGAATATCCATSTVFVYLTGTDEQLVARLKGRHGRLMPATLLDLQLALEPSAGDEQTLHVDIRPGADVQADGIVRDLELAIPDRSLARTVADHELVSLILAVGSLAARTVDRDGRMRDGTETPSGRRWRRVPAVAWVRRYERGWLRGDVVAGAVVASLAVPQALGYASIAGGPVEVGLYAVPVALVAYAIFGSSRQLVVGPVSTVSVLSGSFLASFGVAGTAQAAAYTAALALGSGVVLLAAGFLGVGWMAEFLSKPIVTGFVLGLTVLVILGEVPHLLGVPTPKGQVVERVGALGGSLTRGDADLVTVIVSAVALLVLFGGQGLAPRMPWALVVLLGGLTCSTVLDLRARGVEVVGPVPRGIPTPELPSVDSGDLAALLVAGAALALVGLAEGLSAARLFAGRGGYRIDAGQELLASGAANIASGLFGGIGVAGSLSKTAALSDARGRTQMAGLVAAGLALVVIVAIAPVLSGLPRAVLSAIVVNAVWRLMDFGALRRYARVRRNDIVAAVVAAVGVLAFGPLYGLLLAVAGSVLGLVYRSSRVDVEVMGKVANEKAAWGSTRNHEERRVFPGVMVLRLGAPMFWVTAAPIHDAVLTTVESAPGTRALVLNMEATIQMDTTSADALADLLSVLRKREIDLYLVRVMRPVRKVLRRSGFMAELGEDHLWHSISQGVREARRAHGLTHLPSQAGGVSGAEELPEDELLGEEATEEHIVARSTGPVLPERHP